MSNIVRRAGLLASAVLLCLCSPASAADDPDKSTLDQIKATVDMLAQQQPKHNYTYTDASLSIESWLLTSTAIDGTAAEIRTRVDS